MKVGGEKEDIIFSLLLPTCDNFICGDFAACLFVAAQSNLKLQSSPSLPQAGESLGTQMFPSG